MTTVVEGGGVAGEGGGAGEGGREAGQRGGKVPRGVHSASRLQSLVDLPALKK